MLSARRAVHAAACADGEVYETLLATADHRMYQDKSRRKRRASAWPPHVVRRVEEPADPAEPAENSATGRDPIARAV
jgi:hypothetical protein